MSRTFAQQLEVHRALLDNRRITDRSLAKIRKLLQANPSEPEAWLLYNRADCLTGNAERKIKVNLDDCAHRLGEAFTAEIKLEMLYDCIIGMARDAQRANDAEVAYRALPYAYEARELAQGVKDRANWEPRIAYAEARAKHLAGQPNAALNIHQGAHEMWMELKDKANGRWVVQNLVFLLRSLVLASQTRGAFYGKNDIERACRELQKRAPQVWAHYVPPLVTHDNGLEWFAAQDIRF